MDESSNELQSLFLKFMKNYDKGRILTDKTRTVIWVNPSACKDLSLSEDQLIGAYITDSGLTSGPEKELILIANDNSQIVFNGKIQTITDNGDEYSLFSISGRSIIRTISGAEAELLVTRIPENHERDDILAWALDTEFRYIFYNDNHRIAMKRVWNADIEIGISILDYVTDPEYRLQTEKNYINILEGELRSSIDHFTLKSGENKYYENFGHSMKDKKGTITGLMLYTIDITRRTNLDNQLRISLGLLESIMNSPEDVLIFSIDRDYRYLFFNKAHMEAMKKVWGADIELEADVLQFISDPAYREKTRRFYARSFNGSLISESSILRYPDGTVMQHENIPQPIRNINGDVHGITIFALDVTERLKAENALRESLREKEFLLKEIHHRIKNNFQMISGMLGIQKDTIKDESAKQVLQDSLTRVNTMGMIHESLYKGENLGAINMQEYCGTLVKSLRSLYIGNSPIQITGTFDNIELEIDRAIPAGLIINELITNSLKYAFRDRESGVINLSMKMDLQNIIHLKVEDNGSGLPDDFNLENSSSFGIKLISAFVSQLQGKLKINSASGLSVEILF